MNKQVFTNKTRELAIQDAKIKLEEQNEDNLIINEISSKKSLFSKKVEIEVIEKRELIQFIKEYIQGTLKQMGFNAQIEIFNKDDVPTYRIYSDNDALLIGKNGKNLKALQHVVQQAIKKEINNNFKFVLDISNYQEKKEKIILKKKFDDHTLLPEKTKVSIQLIQISKQHLVKLSNLDA